MNEPYSQIPQINLFTILSSYFRRENPSCDKDKPYDFGKALYIKEWQMEIPIKKDEHFVASFKRTFPELVPSKPLMILGNDTITLYNGLVLHIEVIDRNTTFRR